MPITTGSFTMILKVIWMNKQERKALKIIKDRHLYLMVKCIIELA